MLASTLKKKDHSAPEVSAEHITYLSSKKKDQLPVYS
jgi:hypothetical protein